MLRSVALGQRSGIRLRSDKMTKLKTANIRSERSLTKYASWARKVLWLTCIRFDLDVSTGEYTITREYIRKSMGRVLRILSLNVAASSSGL